MTFLKRTLILASVLCALIANSPAQTRETGIVAAVRDQFGDAVADAELVLVKSGAEEKRIKADARGVGQFLGLSAGEYRITVVAAGFEEYESENVAVKTGETRRVEIVLEIASVESNVEIGEDDNVADAERVGVTATLNEREIAGLPDNQEELERAIKRIGESVAGEELPISVNGVQGGKIPPKDAIQQIRVNQNVFSAQYDGPFGGGIEIFTRSNVDKFRGYVNFTFADSRFNAADPFLGARAPYQSRNYFFNFSGPLFGKKANFFVYGGRSESDLSQVINAEILDANLQSIRFKETFAAPSSSENVSLTINADPTKKHKLYINYNVGVSRSKGQNVGGFSLASRANDNNSQSHYLQFSDTNLINANVVNQTRFLATYFTNDNFGGSEEAAINVLDAFFGGGSQQNFSSRNFRFDATNETTWQLGRYALGFGWRFRGERIRQNSTANFGGTYTFAGRDAPELDADNKPEMEGGKIKIVQINSLESYRRTLLFGRSGFSNERIRELGGGASQFTISGGDPEIKVAQYDAGFYLQNSYKISETVAASFGTRYEYQTNIDSNFNLAPRFGIIWAPKAKDKQNPLYALPRVSIGYGMFYNRFALNNTLNIRQASDEERAQYLITETNVLDFYPNAPTVDQLQRFAQPQTQRFLAAAFETPYQSLLTVTAAKKIPKGFTLNFTFSRGTTFRQAFTQNINAPLAGTYDRLNPRLAVRPLGNVGNVYETRSAARTETDRFSINLGFPNSQKLFANVRYSYLKSKGNVVSSSGSSFDPYDFSREFAPTPFDGVHSLSGYYYYNLPYKISLGSDFYVSSGTRFNIFTGEDTNGDGFFSERPAFATDLSKPDLIETPYGTLDPNPAPGDRLIPRNLGRGPKNVVFNSFVSKTFGFNEDKKNKKPPLQTLNFSLRATNVFNIISKGNPIGNMSSPNFLRTLTGYTDGGTSFINGAQQINFPGRSLNFSVGFGF